MAVRGISQLDKLQETQTTRLRQTLARNNSVSSQESSRDSNNSRHDLTDDLGLMTRTKSKNCEDTTVCVALQDELRSLQSQVSQLNSQLAHKDTELAAMRLSQENERTALAGCGVGSSATQKIVDLSRKNRDLNNDLTREQTRARQLQAQVAKLQTTIKEYEKNEQDSLPNPSQEQQLRDHVVQLQDQLMLSKQKATEYRNQHQTAKQEIKSLRKIISQEVGEKVNISSLINNSSGSGWRGRAQQIIALQNKVSELQKQVSLHRRPSPASPSSSRCSSSFDKQRASAHVQKVESDNRKKMQELKSEFDQLQGDHSKLKQQCCALKARNSTLTSEAKDLRSQINALKKESAIKEVEVHQLKQSIINLENNPKLKNELQKMSETISKLRSQLSHSEGERLRLETRLKKQLAHAGELSLACHSTPISRNRATIDGGNGTCITSNDTASISTDGRASSNAISDGNLPPLVLHGSNQRAVLKKNVRNSLSADGIPQNSKYSESEVEGIVTRARVAEVERERLLELTKMLQQRLDKANDEMIQIKTSRLTQELVTDRLHVGAGNKGEPAKTKNKNTDDLQDQLCILQDENEVLREALEETRQQKLQDIRLLNSLLYEAQKSYTNSLTKCMSNHLKR